MCWDIYTHVCFEFKMTRETSWGLEIVFDY